MVWRRILRLVAGPAAAIAVAGGAVAITATAAGVNLLSFAGSKSSGQVMAKVDPRSYQAYCDRFTAHLADDLGKSKDEVDAAVKRPIGQTIDDAVAAGDLTQAQGDALKSKLGSGQACSPGLAQLGTRRGPASDTMPKGAASITADVLARSLGISVEELKADYAKGMSIHQIADSKGIGERQFRDNLVQNLTPVLDQAVQLGKLTKDQETRILNRVRTGPLPNWDHAPNLKPRPTPPAS